MQHSIVKSIFFIVMYVSFHNYPELWTERIDIRNELLPTQEDAVHPPQLRALFSSNIDPVLCNGSLGDPVVSITYGSGANPGRPLPEIVPGASTNLTFVPVTGNPALPTPLDGQYTITNNVPFNAGWFSGSADHTPGDVNGYMAMYNSQETAGLEFYRQSINNLCGSATYEFSAWIANCLNPAYTNGVDPDIIFRIEEPDGTLLGSYNTNAIPESNSLTWKQYGFLFKLPANVSTVVLRMINNTPGGTNNVGNDLAIDDITFRPCGPASRISFSSTAPVDTLSICVGTSAFVYGTVLAGYVAPTYLWQSSTDNGNTWSDIPASNNLRIPVNSLNLDNNKPHTYRLLTGEGNNINSENCRVTSNQVVLKIQQPPQATITGDSVCQGINGNLTFSFTNGKGPYQLVYTDGVNQFTRQNLPENITVQTQLPVSNTTTFTIVSVRDANNCERVSGFTIPAARVAIRSTRFNPPKDETVCQSKPVVLNSSGSEAFQYAWSPAAFLDDATSPHPVATPDSTIQYAVRIIDPGCKADSTFYLTLTVLSNPKLAVRKSNDITCTSPTSQLIAEGAIKYNWSPASGLDDSTKSNPTARIDYTTKFAVQGTASNGCFSRDSVTVLVSNSGKAVFALPNAFTPNNDGMNDCFGLKNWGSSTLTEFSVFNRWGERIFTTTNPLQCWDGTYKGKLQDGGGYAYIVRAQSLCGDAYKKGIILLVR